MQCQYLRPTKVCGSMHPFSRPSGRGSETWFGRTCFSRSLRDTNKGDDAEGRVSDPGCAWIGINRVRVLRGRPGRERNLRTIEPSNPRSKDLCGTTAHRPGCGGRWARGGSASRAETAAETAARPSPGGSGKIYCHPACGPPCGQGCRPCPSWRLPKPRYSAARIRRPPGGTIEGDATRHAPSSARSGGRRRGGAPRASPGWAGEVTGSLAVRAQPGRLANLIVRAALL